MLNALKAFVVAAARTSAGTAQAADAVAISPNENAVSAFATGAVLPTVRAAARADLHPAIKSLAHFTANLNEARTVFALCAAGRVASTSLEACRNANEAVLVDAVRGFRFDACPMIPVC